MRRNTFTEAIISRKSTFQTSVLRYFEIPIAQSYFSGLVISPDGRYIYVAMAGASRDSRLYVIDTSSRTFIGFAPMDLNSLAISHDGKTLYGTTNGNLISIDAARLAITRSAKVPAGEAFGQVVASSRHVYVSLQKAIAIYDAQTLALDGIITKPGISYIGALGIDDGSSSLYVWDQGWSSNETFVIDLATNATKKRLPGYVFNTVDPITHVFYATSGHGRQCAFQPGTFEERCLYRTPHGILNGGVLTTTN